MNGNPPLHVAVSITINPYEGLKPILGKVFLTIKKVFQLQLIPMRD